MFGFLAFLGPVGIGAAIVGTVAAAAYASIKSDEKSNSESSDSDSNHHEEKNNIINKEIESYKKNQKNRFKNNYGVDIKFVSKIEKEPKSTHFVNSLIFSTHKDKVIVSGIDSKFESIVNLENEIKELKNLVKLLESEKMELLNETI